MFYIVILAMVVIPCVWIIVREMVLGEDDGDEAREQVTYWDTIDPVK